MRGSGSGSGSGVGSVGLGLGISTPSSGCGSGPGLGSGSGSGARWSKLSVRIFGGVATLALLMSMLSFWFALHRETNVSQIQSPSLVSSFRKEGPSSVERGKDSTPACININPINPNPNPISSSTPSDFDVHLGIALDKMDRTALITLVEKAKKEQIHSSSLQLAQFVISALEDASEGNNDPDPNHHHSVEPVEPHQLHSHGNQYGHDHTQHIQHHDVDTVYDQQFQGLDVISVDESHETIQARYDEIIARYPNHPPSSFPIGLVAANRPTLLNRTLTSLLTVHGISATQITVYLDGHLQSMLDVIASFQGVNLMTHENVGAPGEAGANRIARHYKFTLSHLFDDHPNSSYAIIVEDDMLFSPDFLLYFVQTAHLYETDPSIYCISSFNDNGFHERVANNKGMFRTEFFIGLGWLASRKVYKELESRWPSTHWDHWIRSPPQRQNRECIFPEISRNYNIGKVGVHSDNNLFARYFQHIAVNTQPAVDLGDLTYLHKENYEKAMLKSLSVATPMSSLAELNRITPTSHPNGVIIWFHAGSDADRIWEQTIAPLFGIWHTQPNIRGMKDGVSTFLYRDVRVYLVGTFSRYRGEIQPLAPAWEASYFVDPARPRHEIHALVASQGESCDTTCQSHQLKCHKPSLVVLNTCTELEKAFQCTKCDFNQGSDQPAYVANPKKDEYQMCFRNGGTYEYSCSASHADTQRLCACIDS